MKKLLKYLCVLLAMFISISSFGLVSTNSASANSSTIVDKTSFNQTAVSILNDYSAFTTRVAGSVGEKNASEFILNFVKTQTEFKPRNDEYVTDGVQNFSFESVFTGLFEKSQNLIFDLTSTNKTDKKIIISCHYDGVAYKQNALLSNENIVASESVSTSAGSVATLLALARFIPQLNLNYNIELVFFGASESNLAGSNTYTRGIGEKERENIVCAINLDAIAVGKNMYFYVDEIDNDLSKLVSKISFNNKLLASKIDTFHLNKISLGSQNELGLDYMHIALSSDNFNFKKCGIQTINFFAGDYSSGIIMGRSEYAGEDAVAYTANDNREFINEKYGAGSIEKNLYEVYKSVSLILTNPDLEKAAAGAEKSSAWFNLIFANSNLAFYLTVVAFVLFIILAMFIYYKLSVKAYHADVELQFVTSVLKITEEVSNNQVDEKTAQAISQVLANDIKKDKTIKKKKNKNK